MTVPLPLEEALAALILQLPTPACAVLGNALGLVLDAERRGLISSCGVRATLERHVRDDWGTGSDAGLLATAVEALIADRGDVARGIIRGFVRRYRAANAA